MTKELNTEMELDESTVESDYVEVIAVETLRIYCTEFDDRGYWIPKDVILEGSEITGDSLVGAVGKLLLPLQWAMEHRIIR